MSGLAIFWKAGTCDSEILLGVVSDKSPNVPRELPAQEVREFEASASTTVDKLPCQDPVAIFPRTRFKRSLSRGGI